jgi:hypothetical protein
MAAQEEIKLCRMADLGVYNSACMSRRDGQIRKDIGKRKVCNQPEE